MKTRTIFLSILAAATFVSCSKDVADNPDINPEPFTGKAYISFSVNNGSSNVTKANITDQNGLEVESKATSIMAVLFDENGICVDVVTVDNTTAIGNGTTPANGSDAVSVDGKTAKAFIIINKHAGWVGITKNDAVGKTFTELNTAPEINENLWKDDNFMMANAGSYTNGALVNVTVFHEGNGVTSEQAKVNAKASPTAINVDRLSAKVTVKVKSPSIEAKPAGATFAFGGWELNVTNKSSYIYSELVKLTDANATIGAVYRKDNNYLLTSFPDIIAKPKDQQSAEEQKAIADMLKGKFNFLTNGANADATGMSEVKRAADGSAYCAENTMDADAQLIGVTTKVVVKGQYTPDGISEKSSYFAWDGKFYTLAQIKKEYADHYAIDNTAGLAKDFPEFLVAAKIKSDNQPSADDLTATEWKTFVAGLADGDFSATSGVIARGKAVKYYYQSTCYYDVLINHDSGITTPMALGRYGVVRNNWYTLTINSVSGPGTPWIPDPTDPEDPTDPGTPDDLGQAYLSVSITVKPWTTWNQGVDLN